ncbi:MAG: efflux RND transporter periplasmic adaptor subunit [Chloroflexi bacterium]|nr:efflux RND transporter periplasmic adaptor subunit [Chloroflexota bacterium]
MIFWRIFVLVAVLVGGAFGGYAAYQKIAGKPKVSTPPQMVAVRRGNVSSTVSTTGNVAMPTQAKLSFGAGSTVVEVDVKEGDQVKKGQTLAKLDTSVLELAVKTAELKLRTAQINVQKLQAPPTDADVTKAQAAVESAKAALVNAQNNLDKAQQPPDPSAVADAQAAIRQATSGVTDAQVAIKQATTALETARRQRDITANSDAVNKTPLDRQNEYNFYEVKYGEALQKFSAGQIDQATLDLAYANMVGANDRLQTAKLNAVDTMAQADNNVAKAEDSLRKANDGVPKAEDALRKANDNLATLQKGPDPADIQTKQAQVTSAQAGLTNARLALTQLLKGADPNDIEIAKNNLTSAQQDLANAKDQLAGAVLVAPFDGVVASVGANVGDRVTSSTVIVQLVNPENVQIKAMVAEVDVAQTKVGQDANITLDALPAARLRGKVAVISPLAVRQQGVVSYSLTIDVQKDPAVALLEGMTATATVTVESRQNVLLVSSRAVRSQGNARTVQVMVNGKSETRQVQVGLSDGQSTEITQGLQEGDEVVIPAAGTTQTQQQGGPIRIPGGGGFMPGM